MSEHRIIDVAAGILWQDGRFLAVRRPPGTSMAGYWEFPGGKVEPGESAERALVRELDEELGVRARQMEFARVARHDYDHVSVRLHFFHVREVDGEPEPREGQEMAWLMPGVPCDLTFLPADEDILAEIIGLSAPGGEM
ncbi:NUDIX hydrolase [Desulfovibrio sp. X2]|uniref:(deoxy)nucleoside triphosphate pyrophosphohydrolase n=1 Tax=Desulfovibrio sp. X2 TaxID=941449 RepID=UPI000358D74A|nr:(deoxy)nucleoside triphosphate pyrophosphohydrolase [Desulfovibrio sp. X2]EPR42674.1 NUDIX hydrolase [Desulfovibrio sp. X2]